MPRWLSFAIFIVVAFAIIGSLHYYVWARLVRDPALSHPWRAVLTVTLIALAVGVPAAYALGRGLGSPWREISAWPSVLWMGSIFLLFFVVLGTDLARWVVSFASRLFADGDSVDPERRLLLARIFAGGAAVSTLGLGVIATRQGIAAPEICDVEVKLARLPAGLDGLKIVQLTDMHVGPTIGRAFVDDVVARANALNPDIIAITGDLVDGSVAELRRAVAPLTDLVAKHGVYFVTGNHEYYAGAVAWLRELDRMGLRVLHNERVSIGAGADVIDLAGVEDYSAARFASGHQGDLGRILAGRDTNRELVLLAHQPKHVHAAAEHGVGLQLSGHTHGGQIWPFTYLVHLVQPYVAGLAWHGNTQIYVSRGTGYWGPPMRLGAPSEVTQVTLRRS